MFSIMVLNSSGDRGLGVVTTTLLLQARLKMQNITNETNMVKTIAIVDHHNTPFDSKSSVKV